MLESTKPAGARTSIGVTSRPASSVLCGTLVAVMVVFALTGCSSDASGSPGASDPPDRSSSDHATRRAALTAPDTADSLLFVARSERGALTVRPDQGSTLELSDVDTMTWFSDRPARDAGTSSVEAALGAFGWEHNGDALGDDPPNGALVAAELGEDSLVVELLTASVDHDRVTFTVAFIDAAPESTELSDVELFIDSTSEFPIFESETLPNDVVVGTSLSADDDGVIAELNITSSNGTFGNLIVSTDQPYTTPTTLTVGSQTLEITVVMRHGYAGNPSSISASGLVSDVNGQNLKGFDQYVADWDEDSD